MSDRFAIDILELCWLNGMPEENDLCAHGIACIRIGDSVLEGEVSMSAAALHLLRTVENDHEPDEMAKLFPTDGFCWTPASEEYPYDIYLGGCPNGGFDGSVTHEGGFVCIALENAPPIRVPLEAYRVEVFRFADAVERLFQESKPKVVQSDLDTLWYAPFWAEWHRRRNQD